MNLKGHGPGVQVASDHHDAALMPPVIMTSGVRRSLCRRNVGDRATVTPGEARLGQLGVTRTQVRPGRATARSSRWVPVPPPGPLAVQAPGPGRGLPPA